MPDGSFAHFAFHPQSEFAADFGAYDVTLDVPSATWSAPPGSCQRPAGPRAERAAAPTALPRGRRARLCLDQLGWLPSSVMSGIGRGRRAGAGAARTRRNAAIELDTVRFGLQHFGEGALAPTRYPTLTVVHPPSAAARLGRYGIPDADHDRRPVVHAYLAAPAPSKRLTIHELGHQWFYGLFASDEHRTRSWMKA